MHDATGGAHISGEEAKDPCSILAGLYEEHKQHTTPAQQHAGKQVSG
jgi:hypothetical protein